MQSTENLTTLLASTEYFVCFVNIPYTCFRVADLKWVDQLTPDRPHLVLDMDLSQFLEALSFAIAALCAQHVNESQHMSNETFAQELALPNSFW
jgi:hypothetical protein